MIGFWLERGKHKKLNSTCSALFFHPVETRLGSTLHSLTGLCDPTLYILPSVRCGIFKKKEGKKSNLKFKGIDPLSDRRVCVKSNLSLILSSPQMPSMICTFPDPRALVDFQLI